MSCSQNLNFLKIKGRRQQNTRQGPTINKATEPNIKGNISKNIGPKFPFTSFFHYYLCPFIAYFITFDLLLIYYYPSILKYDFKTPSSSRVL